MNRDRLILGGVLLVHAALLAYSSFRMSVVNDETGHLPAGLSHWEFRKFDLFAVNPPLVRTVAAIPAALSTFQTDWSRYRAAPRYRSEMSVGQDMVEANPGSFIDAWRRGRWACIPFSLVGAMVCYRWATDLHGRASGWIALLLWCFCPNVLAHASLITPDAAAASMGAAACFRFWKWQVSPSWSAALAAGLVLGLAELTKFTWLFLYLFLPTAWLVRGLVARRWLSRSNWLRDIGQLIVLLLVSLYVINVGYLFEGTFTQLGNFQFSSAALTGHTGGNLETEAMNRFHNTWISSIPVPLPRNMVLGIDQIKYEYERGYWSYLRGEHRLGGWWYYYLYALLVKIPIGTWCLFIISFPVAVLHLRGTKRVYDQLFLITPPVLVISLVSWQTGFNHHLRYVLPAFPFLLVFAAQSVQVLSSKYSFVRMLPVAGLAWTILSSLTVYPHSMTYFNEIAGGPRNGWRHLGSSNIDWGQGLLLLKEWQNANPHAKPLRVSYSGAIEPKHYGIECIPANSAVTPHSLPGFSKRHFEPGWYALSVNRMLQHDADLAAFLRFEPIDRLGYSIYIYHLDARLNVP